MITLICHGDSLTEGADLDRGFTWPALTGASLGIRTVNRGIGGDTSAGLLARFHPDVIQPAPEFVLILCGTNDLWWGLPANAILANVFAMAYQAQYAKITPILATPLPFHAEIAQAAAITPPADGFDECGAALLRYVGELKAAADRSEIPCIDLYAPFLDAAGAVRGDLFLEDGLHANRAGHRVVAEAVINRLRADFLLCG